MTDQEIIQGILRRDETVFRELVDSYQQQVIRTCYGLVHDEQDARDLAQEVFIEIIHSAGEFRGNAKLSSWIYRISINKSLNHLKRQNRRHLMERIGLRSAADGRETVKNCDIPACEGADSSLEQKEMKQALHQAINALPVNQRIAFTMHKYEDCSYKEIAEVMNVSVASVESLMHRAKENLQRILSDYYEGRK